MSFIRNTNLIKLCGMLYITFFIACVSQASPDISTFIENFEKNNKQTVLTGGIDSLTIIRGNAEFHLGAGELTLFDFALMVGKLSRYRVDVIFEPNLRIYFATQHREHDEYALLHQQHVFSIFLHGRDACFCVSAYSPVNVDCVV